LTGQGTTVIVGRHPVAWCSTQKIRRRRTSRGLFKASSACRSSTRLTGQGTTVIVGRHPIAWCSTQKIR
jgi:hypothetical protein